MSDTVRSAGLIALLSAALILPLSAQAPVTAETPEQVARNYSEAVFRGEWQTAAAFMHPRALREFRELFVPIVNTAGMEELREQFFGAATAGALSAMSDTAVFAAFIERIVGEQGEMADAMRTARVTAYGHVAGGADTVLVVSRTTMRVEGVEVSQFEVIPMLRHGETWRALLRADFTNMAAMLRRSAP